MEIKVFPQKIDYFNGLKSSIDGFLQDNEKVMQAPCALVFFSAWSLINFFRLKRRCPQNVLTLFVLATASFA